MSDGPFYRQVMGEEEGPYTAAELGMLARSGALKADALVRRDEGRWFPASEVPGVFSSREWLVAPILSLLVGTLGIDRFYLGHIGLGVLKLVTCGGMGIWAIVDLILIALNALPDAEGRPLKR